MGGHTCALADLFRAVHSGAAQSICVLCPRHEFQVTECLRKLRQNWPVSGEGAPSTFPDDYSDFPRRRWSRWHPHVDRKAGSPALLDTGWTGFCEAPRQGAPPMPRPCDPKSLSTLDQDLAKTVPGGCLAAIQDPLPMEQLRKPTEWAGSV